MTETITQPTMVAYVLNGPNGTDWRYFRTAAAAEAVRQEMIVQTRANIESTRKHNAAARKDGRYSEIQAGMNRLPQTLWHQDRPVVLGDDEYLYEDEACTIPVMRDGRRARLALSIPLSYAGGIERARAEAAKRG